MTSVEEADTWIGRTAVDATGEQVGRITQIWVDDASGQPEWASLRGAMLGSRGGFVPLAGSTAIGGGRQFLYTKEQIAKAPRVAQDGHLDVADKERVAAYYDDLGGQAMVAPAAGWTDLAGYGPTPLSDGPSQSGAPERGLFPKPSRRRSTRKAAPQTPAPALAEAEAAQAAAPALAEAAPEQKEGRRSRRKSAPAVDKPASKPGRRFRRKGAASDQHSAEEAAQAEMALGA